MIEYIVPLLESYVVSDFIGLWFYPLIAGYFVGSVPAFIRIVTKWR